MFRNRNIAVILLVIVGVMGMAFTSTAQDSITFGDVVQDTAAGEALNYTLTLEEDSVAVILTQSDAFDTTLTLLDPSGEQVAFNDDSQGTLNSQIAFSAVEAGDYTVVVDALGGSPEGDFILVVLGGTCVADNRSVTEDSFEQTVTIPEGDTVVLGVSSDDFDTTLTILDSAGEEVAFNDDGGDGLNSQLIFVAPATDTYTMVTSSFGGEPTEGAYEIMLAGGTAPIEDTVSGTTEYTTFDGVAGEAVIISLTSDDFDTYIRVLDASGTEVAFNDDGGDGLNSLLTFIPTEDGEYTIVVDSFSGAPEGTFQFNTFMGCSLEDDEASSEDMSDDTSGEDNSSDSSTDGGGSFLDGMNVMDMGTIAVAESVNVTAEGTIDVYSITLDEGQTVTINLSSDDFDAFLIVATDTSASEPLGFNDDIDYPENTNSELEFTAPSAGTYIIIASSLSGEATGSYTLSVQ